MCGILGYSSKTQRPDLKKALDAIKHRGPDGSGVFYDTEKGVGVAHVRLSIIDPSPAGNQPMVSDDGRLVLTYNGELYDFQDHQAHLQESGNSFHGNSDTEVLLRLIETEGIQVLERLNGIFAFAILDRSTGELTLARDAIGVKPLYYSISQSGFFFSSEIKGLSALGVGLGSIDEVALDRYLTSLWCPGTATPFKGVRKLGPGEAMTVHQGKILRRWQWYTLPAKKTTPRRVSSVSASKATEAHLRQAVHRQMVADVPVGAFLSGGLDSSAIVAFAREVNPGIRCFTIKPTGGDDEGETSDLPYAYRVAKHLNVPLDVVHIDSQTMANDLEKMVIQLDEPLADPAPLNVLYISQLARTKGIKVLLSGAGGDDLFTGYRRHWAVQTEKYWRWLPKNIRGLLERETQNLDHRRTMFRRVAKLFNGASLDGDDRIVNYFAWARRDDLRKLYSPAFKSAIGDAKATEPMLEFLSEMPKRATSLERMLALEQRFFLTDHNLTYTDKMSMAAGVEVRVPFLDLELVKFAATLPMHLKQHGSEGKWILKKAMEDYLPHDVIYRPKTGFGAPLRRWMRHELRELLGDLLSEESLKQRGFFNPSAVQQLISRNDSGKIDASYTLLSLLCIEIWCRFFLDPPQFKTTG
ncbi:MAG: asparagine synthase (glutamine-hydrolyzing) [Verrucomicrobia bacterium]|nr:asparagine synthase (glutamine-hydrolyzing) [Verrucomicrobiota bacterium]